MAPMADPVDTPPAPPPGPLKKAGTIVLGILAVAVVGYGLWLEVLGMTHPFAYAFGRTAQGQVLSTHTFRFSLWAWVRYQDEGAITHEAEVQMIDAFNAEVVPGATVTVHYFPWLTSSPCINNHWVPDYIGAIAFLILGLVVLILPFGLWAKLTAKRTAV